MTATDVPAKAEKTDTAPRNSRSDGNATYARILETAGELFAAQGFAQTPNKAIAAAAQVDLASINYHFGNRDGLYQAVLIEAHSRIISLMDLQQLADSPLPPAEKLRLILHAVIQKALNNQGWHTAIIAQAITQHAQTLRLLDGEMLPKSQLLKKILSDISGIDENDPALLPCVLSIIAPLLTLFLFGKNMPAPLLGLQNQSPEAIAETLHRYAVAGLAGVGGFNGFEIK
ncbi:MAG: TetR/AcrR family transcriptional regulator [Moraxella sp.]|nr:TetR/AcrR family transcriptional regulator [Moraxella sp.]